MKGEGDVSTCASAWRETAWFSDSRRICHSFARCTSSVCTQWPRQCAAGASACAGRPDQSVRHSTAAHARTRLPDGTTHARKCAERLRVVAGNAVASAHVRSDGVHSGQAVGGAGGIRRTSDRSRCAAGPCVRHPAARTHTDARTHALHAMHACTPKRAMHVFATTCAAHSRDCTGAGEEGGEYLALPLLLLGGVLFSDAQLVLELCSPRMLRAAPA